MIYSWFLYNCFAELWHCHVHRVGVHCRSSTRGYCVACATNYQVKVFIHYYVCFTQGSSGNHSTNAKIGLHEVAHAVGAGGMQNLT